MSEASTIGLDIAKHVFQGTRGRWIWRRRVPQEIVANARSRVPCGRPRCVVAMETRGGAHHWTREICRLGHTVRPIPPAYVKPVVKRQKNHAAAAEAICKAVQRPTMRFAAVKSEEAQEAAC